MVPYYMVIIGGIYKSKFRQFYIHGRQCPWSILGIIGQYPSVSKTKWLHVDIP